MDVVPHDGFDNFLEDVPLQNVENYTCSLDINLLDTINVESGTENPRAATITGTSSAMTLEPLIEPENSEQIYNSEMDIDPYAELERFLEGASQSRTEDPTYSQDISLLDMPIHNEIIQIGGGSGTDNPRNDSSTGGVSSSTPEPLFQLFGGMFEGKPNSPKC
ncbi:hypothetical protein Bhyg_16268 [Pseudolycoriella hygida]|uniref:Uncharacterized protein n=1 Tax=Pseudolycoriella hygida TaxID=35572 RepID=A0A9Q0MHG4_9DIPT|nr:hypothetical protein Bhyg_16268 [Pseudolycoriella hygida]